MRQWLSDRRAYAIYRQWLSSPYRQYGGGYDQIEHFREWVYKHSDKFFDITQAWPDQPLKGCCDCLIMDVPK